MSKLFEISYLLDSDFGSYLTIGKNEDTEDTVTKRELEAFGDTSCLYSFYAKEVNEINGHRIIVED